MPTHCRAADGVRGHVRMNAAVAEDIAAAHPRYFTRIESLLGR